MRNDRYSPQRFGTLVVALHFVVALVHGAAHSGLHIEMNLWQSIFILFGVLMTRQATTNS